MWQLSAVWQWNSLLSHNLSPFPSEHLTGCHDILKDTSVSWQPKKFQRLMACHLIKRCPAFRNQLTQRINSSLIQSWICTPWWKIFKKKRVKYFPIIAVSRKLFFSVVWYNYAQLSWKLTYRCCSLWAFLKRLKYTSAIFLMCQSPSHV